MRPSTIDLERALEMRESTNPETGQPPAHVRDRLGIAREQ
jgi:hypothetical protein